MSGITTGDHRFQESHLVERAFLQRLED